MVGEENLKDAVLRLKKEKKALLLSHNYQPIEIQEVADYVGDSLELCLAASRSKGFERIVFCGVDFMAESAAVLNPDKEVYVPSRRAICDMAAMLGPEQVGAARKEHPAAAVVLYINSLASAKAEADIICTSANAVKVVSSLGNDEVLFGPDRNLALYVQSQLPEKRIIPLPDDGGCYVHRMIRPDDIRTAKREHPGAEVLIHPECNPDVVELADFVVSTGGMVSRARQSDAKEFIIGTEATMAETLSRLFPEKGFYPALPTALCRGMRSIDMGQLVDSLREDKYLVKVDASVAEDVRRVTQRMLDLGRR